MLFKKKNTPDKVDVSFFGPEKERNIFTAIEEWNNSLADRWLVDMFQSWDIKWFSNLYNFCHNNREAVHELFFNVLVGLEIKKIDNLIDSIYNWKEGANWLLNAHGQIDSILKNNPGRSWSTDIVRWFVEFTWKAKNLLETKDDSDSRFVLSRFKSDEVARYESANIVEDQSIKNITKAFNYSLAAQLVWVLSVVSWVAGWGAVTKLINSIVLDQGISAEKLLGTANFLDYLSIWVWASIIWISTVVWVELLTILKSLENHKNK